ncbi:hypothetical protein LCGC14_3164460 [marine sediment metagenome]|uniref:Ryanodine receptor Ryr domain-containing protein n=1 Tax=marine sediment metagenome TaxID=412755 RepID=A0A0F8VP04_9ZZZZ
MLPDEAVARVAHEVNRAYCVSIGDGSQVPWSNAPDWQRASAMEGVSAIREGRAGTPEESHQGWCDHKRAAGWKYGPVKDPSAKTHPCLVPYDELPPEQRAKDDLFVAIVTNMIRID